MFNAIVTAILIMTAPESAEVMGYTGPMGPIGCKTHMQALNLESKNAGRDTRYACVYPKQNRA